MEKIYARDAAQRISLTISHFALSKYTDMQRRQSGRLRRSANELIYIFERLISPEEVASLQKIFVSELGKISNPIIIDKSDLLGPTKDSELKLLSLRGFVNVGSFDDNTRYYLIDQGLGAIKLSKLGIIRIVK